MNELISVIMSTYNEEPEWIKKAIDSILNQTYSEIEFIIILDNPKNEMLKELLLEYQAQDKRVKVIPNKENIGLVKSLNIALEHCSGTYIARMDADDISMSDRLSKEKQYLEENHLDFIFSGMIVIDETGKQLFEWDNNAFTPEQIKNVMGIWNISLHPTWFLKREVYQTLGGYREIPYCEDYDFSLRALNHGYKIGKLNENLLFYRMRSTGISKSNNFEQFLISHKITQLYKRDRLDDISYVHGIVNSLKRKMNATEKSKYSQAEEIFHKGVECIKEGKLLQGLFILQKSIFMSKYHIIKVIDLFKYKSATKR